MRPDEAMDALERARVAEQRTRSRGAWYAVFAAAYAAASCALLLALGLAPSKATALWVTPAFLAVVAALVVFALRQPVRPRGFGALHVGAMAAWGVVYMVTLMVGVNVFPGETAWWVSGAVASTVPPLAAGCVAWHRGRSTA